MRFWKFRSFSLSAVLVLFWGPAVFAQPITYDGHSVVSVTVSTKEEAALLDSMKLDIQSCSNAKAHVGTVLVRVSPAQLADLDRSGLRYRTSIADIGPLVAAQRVQLRGATFHQSYHTLAQLNAEVQSLANAYPAIAQVQNFGTSLEGRPLTGLRITGPGSGPDKPGMFIHGGQHAREWIGPATMMYIADWLLTNYGSNAAATSIVDDVEWFILPVMNPDGYEYTWTDFRMWRKNRRNNGDGTFGVDLNRNWGGVGWGGEGSSPDPSTDIYHGPSPFSEPETQAMRDFIWAHANIVGYIDFHSFSELILWPWGYTPALSADQDEFLYIGTGMHDSIFDVHNHSYTYGPIYTTIYPASGGSADWVYGGNIAQRFIAGMSIELRDTGEFGFLLPPEQIIPTAEENLQAVLFMASAVSEPLRVNLLSAVPSTLAPDQGLEVVAEAIPRYQDIVTDGVVLNYRTGGGTFLPLTMTALGGDQFSATIPPSDCGSQLDFYVQVEGDQGAVVAYPENAPSDMVSLEVGFTFTVVKDEFEVSSGWVVGEAGDNAVTGVWTLVNPIGTIAQPEDDHTSPPGVQCFVTGQGSAGGGPGENDVDAGRTTLRSPLFAVPSASLNISYAIWFTTNGGPGIDELSVSASSNGGGSWSNVELISANTDGWEVHSFRPSDVGLSASSQMRLRFAAADLAGASLVEAAVDDFMVSRFGCPDGDSDHDGGVDLADHDSFADCMNGPTGLSVSDACRVFNFNIDTDVDMNDYLDFMLRFGS